MSDAPERIYGWLDSQLSLARFAGGCTFNGHRYTIAFNEDRQPLVRWDVLKREVNAAKEAKKAVRELTILEQVDADLFGVAAMIEEFRPLPWDVQRCAPTPIAENRCTTCPRWKDQPQQTWGPRTPIGFGTPGGAGCDWKEKT